jgi:adenosylcobinamide hydrolase
VSWAVVKSTPLLVNVTLDQYDDVLHVRSDVPLAIMSSAVVGGDLAVTRHILNLHVPKDYTDGDHAARLRAAAAALGITEPCVGLLTAAWLDWAEVVSETAEEVQAVVVATIGISHPTAAGVTPAAPPYRQPRPAGTINLILVVDARLSLPARVNLVITATEAKALALMEAGVRAPHGGPASGTGTDAIVVASTERGPLCEYAGPVAPVGALVGRLVRRAMQAAIAVWRPDQPPRRDGRPLDGSQ